MQSTSLPNQEKGPYLQLLILFGLIFGAFILLLIGTVIYGFVAYGSNFLNNPNIIQSLEPSNIFALKIQLILQQLILFLFPAILLAVIERQQLARFYGTATPKLVTLFLVFLIMFFSTPIMSWIAELNQNMSFPSYLKGIERWMKAMEDAGEETTKAILKTSSISGLIFNLLVIALVPAICEEFLFRGALQRIFIRMFYNHHIGIWIGAIVFSTIHMQFFGFFPRMFLGAAFGYIYYWTGSLNYTIFAHFLNNAFAVSVSYYLQINHLPQEKADEMNVHWYGYVFSAILTIALFKILKNNIDKYRMEELSK
jgi:membrane protease YdiL (CAAX protease family)